MPVSYTHLIVLQDGDLINVGTYEKIVTVVGKVKRPMKYELKGDELSLIHI